jgi:HEPN domain-containing protein
MPPDAAQLRNWLLKARNDWSAARKLLRGPEPETDVVGFHCQQAVEKLLKAFLLSRSVEFEKIHDLRRLIDQCAALDPEFNSLREDVRPLTAYAVASRYPGLPSLVFDEAQQALVVVRKIWAFAATRLPPHVVPPEPQET